MIIKKKKPDIILYAIFEISSAICYFALHSIYRYIFVCIMIVLPIILMLDLINGISHTIILNKKGLIIKERKILFIKWHNVINISYFYGGWYNCSKMLSIKYKIRSNKHKNNVALEYEIPIYEYRYNKTIFKNMINKYAKKEIFKD